MGAAYPAKFCAQAVNFHIASRMHSQFLRAFPVSGIRVGKMERFMKGTVWIFPIDCIIAFGSFVIALAILRADGFPAQRDFVSF